MLTDDTTVSVFTDMEGCDWQTAVTIPFVAALPLLLLLVAYRGYG